MKQFLFPGVEPIVHCFFVLWPVAEAETADILRYENDIVFSFACRLCFWWLWVVCVFEGCTGVLQSLVELHFPCCVIFICFFFLCAYVFGGLRRERVGEPVRDSLPPPPMGHRSAFGIEAGSVIGLASFLLLLPSLLLPKRLESVVACMFCDPSDHVVLAQFHYC